jgi:hypothetical protein
MTTRINNAEGDFRHTDFLQTLKLDFKEREFLKLFVKIEDNREINRQHHIIKI